MTWNIILSIVKGLKIQNFMKAVSHWLWVWQSNDIDAHNVFSDSCTYTCSAEFWQKVPCPTMTFQTYRFYSNYPCMCFVTHRLTNRRIKEREGEGKKRKIRYEYASNCQIFLLLENLVKNIYIYTYIYIYIYIYIDR